MGGGGSGGPAVGGGGGGGAVIYMPNVSIVGDQAYSFFVGAGGVSVTGWLPTGGIGQNSTAFGAIASGGGTGGSLHNSGTNGGSGGGA